VDRQRSRVPLPPKVEAAARIGFAWLRDQHSFRARRPLTGFAARTIEYFSLRGRQATVEAEMARLRVLVGTADGTIGRSVYTSGDWDPLLVGTVFDALDRFGQPFRGRTFVEVGANFGVYCLPAVASWGFARAVGYEPDPAAFELLRTNIERNDLTESVSAHHAALSAASGELTLQLGGYNAGDNRIVDGDGYGDGDTATAIGPTVRVAARTFDDEVAAGRIPLADVGLVWLDVQGHEREVLAGARTLLDAGVPLVIEYATEMMDRDARAGLEDMLAASYAVMVDLGWCALTDRLCFQPSAAIRNLAADGRAVETDLLMLPAPPTR